MAKILLVEDDRSLSAEIVSCLKALNMTVDRCATIEQARILLDNPHHDLLILDWNLPDGEGPDLLRDLRRQGCLIPTIMLTAKTQISEKLDGFQAGADDYLTKPFAFAELVARIKGLLRRVPQESNEAKLTLGPLELDTAKCVVSIQGEALDLRRREYQILELLVKQRGTTVNAEQIITKVWPDDSEVDSEVVRCHIAHIRQKLGDHKDVVSTVYGKGYKIETGEPC